MKKFLFLFSMILFVPVLLTAQEEQRPQRQRMTVEERAKKTTEWMKETLALTPEQIAPVDSINLLFTKTQQILIQSAEGDREKIKDALNALEIQKVEALKKVLTEEQLTLYQQKAEELKNRFRNREGQRPKKENEQ